MFLIIYTELIKMLLCNDSLMSKEHCDPVSRSIFFSSFRVNKFLFASREAIPVPNSSLSGLKCSPLENSYSIKTWQSDSPSPVFGQWFPV